jgi:Phytanoyl-CoA dioxygenase (PhyH)
MPRKPPSRSLPHDEPGPVHRALHAEVRLKWLKTLALGPWWVLQLLSSAKSFRDNPLLGSTRLNRLGLHRTRVRLAHAMTARRRRRLEGLVSAEDRAAFDRDGFVLHRHLLSPEAFAALKSRLLAHPAASREMTQGDTVTRRIAIDNALASELPELNALLAHPVWAGLTRYVCGYHRAPWAYVQAILSQVCPGEPDPQTQLHADTFHPTMKAWFFLTDVAEDEGPFCYVPGSHRLTQARLDWEQARSLTARDSTDRLSARGSFRIKESELGPLGLPPPQRFAVPANTLVVADTFGFHARGPSRGSSVRIEIWGYDRRNPYFPSTTDGALALFGLTDRRAPLYWRWLDQLEAWRLARNPWRDAGVKTAGAPVSSFEPSLPMPADAD